MTDRYAVIGNPIAHSQSPRIHTAFARQCGHDLDYQRILAEPAGFVEAAGRFFASGGCGLNVTAPFKGDACAFANEHSVHAAAAQAVNTLIRLADGRIRGDNTDGVGLVRDLADNHGFDFAARRILLLGAGGAACGVLGPLLEQGPAELLIANRTASRAEALAATGGSTVHGCGLEALDGRRFDLVINATSARRAADLPSLPADCLLPDGWVYDLIYADTPTPFCQWGLAHGARMVLDGLGMLVEQAAESFWLWRGVRPDTAAVIAALRDH